MAVLPKEAALLLAIDAGLRILISEKERPIVDSLRSGGYIDYATDNLKDASVVSPRGALRLTTLGTETVQFIKNELANMGVLDINEGRPLPRVLRDVTPTTAHITKGGEHGDP